MQLVCTAILTPLGGLSHPLLPLTLHADASWTISELIEAVEEALTSVSVSLIINAARVLPLSETVSCINGDFHVVADAAARAPTICQPRNSSEIPITILTGFLGAGKTTLLNHLLHAQRDKKFAVIENEFGAVQIDADLIDTRLAAAEQVIVMENGCMCCSVRGDILGAFSSIL